MSLVQRSICTRVLTKLCPKVAVIMSLVLSPKQSNQELQMIHTTKQLNSHTRPLKKTATPRSYKKTESSPKARRS
ncbi:hypothetical protein GBA52_004184 [Prunus armeniaca]|nr:hypothetical protein GBA52_004184 [Prunus armeniaca]